MSMAAYLTKQGLTVINKLIASRGILAFTKVELGSGQLPDGADPRDQKSLISKVTDATLYDVHYEGGEAKITAQYINTNLRTGFLVNEIGWYVRDPDSSNSVLYCYATFGDTPDWIAPATSAQYTRTYSVTTIISDIQEVTIVPSSSPAFVTADDFETQKNIVNTEIRAVAIDLGVMIRDALDKNEKLEKKVDQNNTSLGGRIDDANALIVQKEAALQEEITQKESSLQNEMRELDDHQAKNDHMIMVTIFEELYGVIRNLDARLTTAEAQLSSIVDNP